ncbi:putative AdoMet-dependent methyltransferase [Bacillus sp. SORGH_AS 510]|uniref:class I SAM-dependent methyltransferase n=1 Tax=Bacillus sp. SORGH_AS_0510 TaxID=3041771 RepID=UPI00278B117F|nr:class I SAM-dependent methyltransferase [Bacillus sp. SORGH_AS_0510]MDQ1144944.1 putative AdoMet-dependent methyltransferase [Bacillus sp. SORGH_AS_0510]
MGREFLEIFEQWADSYDDTVFGYDREYKGVFLRYEEILGAVAEKSKGHVVEFGVGTGNLTQKLIVKGLKVTGVEPSPSMRKIAHDKLDGKVELHDGDFLHFPETKAIDTLVSTYAFHHLTDDEKAKSIGFYGKLLSKGGRIVFADTMFESEEDYKQQIVKAKNDGFHNLAKDLETEYYTTIPFLKNILEKNCFSVTFTRFNDFVWLMEGVKQ